jgi:hypothetical protein
VVVEQVELLTARFWLLLTRLAAELRERGRMDVTDLAGWWEERGRWCLRA